jgi:hypothetical protein
MVQQWVDNYIQANGQQPKQAEYRQAVANLLAKVKVPGTVFGATWPSEKRMFKVQGGEQIIVDGKVTTKPTYTAESPARPASFADAQKLPPGTPFINPVTGQFGLKK